MQARARRVQKRLLVRPRRDQRFVDGVELIALGKAVLEPRPLHHRRFIQTGRRVGIIFKHLGLPVTHLGAAIGQIKPAVNRGR